MTAFIHALRRAVEALTCHHMMYGTLAGFYAAAMLHLCDKDLLTQVAMAVYFTLALRP